MVMNIQVTVFQVVMLCSDVVRYHLPSQNMKTPWSFEMIISYHITT